MNIKDVPSPEVEGDKLEAIFTRQRELERKYNKIEQDNGALLAKQPIDIDTFYGQERVRSLIYRICEELYEAGNCLRNKAWKQTQVPTDVDHFLEEISDAFHFQIQLFLELGLTPKEVCSLYFRKSEVNKFRQRSKY